MSNLREASNPKLIRFIHRMPLLIIWSYLGESLGEIRPSMNLCHADSNSTLGGWTFYPSSSEDVKQDTEATALLLWLGFLAQKAISAAGEELPRQTALSSLSSLLAVRFAANMVKVKGQFLVFTSSIVCIPRPIQEALSGNQQSLNLNRWEVTPSSFWDVFLGVGYHPVPEMKV